MMQRFKHFIEQWPKTSCLLAGGIAAFAMPPFYIWPVMMFSLSLVTLIIVRQTNPWRAAWCNFFFGLGFFTIGLWWIVNALMTDIEDYWWAIGFSILGLPILLSICWFIAGWLTVKLTKPGTMARAALFLTLLLLAEYGRAFNLTGFPWNLFGYMWAALQPIMQLAALGGAYFVTALTVLWMATPALWKLAAGNRTRQWIIAGASIATFVIGFGYGVVRLATNPPSMRDDVAVVIVQPNLTPEEKWQADQVLEHFQRHVRIMKAGLDSIASNLPPTLKTVVAVWPETSLEERLIMTVPEAPKALIDLMEAYPFETKLVTGLWREENADVHTRTPKYYNSIGIISIQDHKLNLDDLYNKHHLVPFGEFVPLEQTLGFTPLVGFAGFQWGDGPKVLHSGDLPPVAPMICFEAIFPWYGASEGADWLVNTSNDGWYGNTAGPYQHLAMSRYRAVEQGKPMMRAATTGISAVIDPYGRLLQTMDYQRRGFIVSALPNKTAHETFYARYGESLFFLMLVLGFAISARLRFKEI